MHEPVRYHFKTNRVFAEGIDYQWQADLADSQYKNTMTSAHLHRCFLLTCIDVFSKYAWVVPFRNKTGPSLVSAFKIILSINRKPTFLQTDDGTEFKNSVFLKFLKENDIKFFTAKSEKKVSIVERFKVPMKRNFFISSYERA